MENRENIIFINCILLVFRVTLLERQLNSCTLSLLCTYWWVSVGRCSVCSQGVVLCMCWQSWVQHDRHHHHHNFNIIAAQQHTEGMGESTIVVKDGELLQGIIDKAHCGPSPYGLVHSVYEVPCTISSSIKSSRLTFRDMKCLFTGR